MQELSRQQITQALTLVGEDLARTGDVVEIVVIGGANLIATELVPRTTEDVDIVAIRRPDGSLASAIPLPSRLDASIQLVADALGLDPYWMNGKSSADFALGLPPGCETRFTPLRLGGLTVLLAHRRDIVAWKLLAAGERYGEPDDHHLPDLIALRPTQDEVEFAMAWCRQVVAPQSAFWALVERVLGEVSDEH